MSRQDSIMYWRLRVLVDALEKIAIPDEPKPGISVPTKKELKLLLAEATIQVPEEDTSPESHENDERFRELLDKKTLLLLDKWISVEIKKLSDDVVQAYKWSIGRSDREKDKELLKKLERHSNPLDLISDRLGHENEEELFMNEEIERWSRIRDVEMDACNTEIMEMNSLLKGYNKELTSGEYAAKMEQYADLIKLESNFFHNKQRLMSMRQKMAENPSEVMNELELSYKRLLDTQDLIRQVLQDLTNKKTKYDALGPEFLTLLKDWKEYGQLIQQKEYVLIGMDAVMNNEQSFNVSLNSSLVFESP